MKPFAALLCEWWYWTVPATGNGSSSFWNKKYENFSLAFSKHGHISHTSVVVNFFISGNFSDFSIVFGYGNANEFETKQKQKLTEIKN